MLRCIEGHLTLHPPRLILHKEGKLFLVFVASKNMAPFTQGAKCLLTQQRSWRLESLGIADLRGRSRHRKYSLSPMGIKGKLEIWFVLVLETSMGISEKTWYLEVVLLWDTGLAGDLATVTLSRNIDFSLQRMCGESHPVCAYGLLGIVQSSVWG